MGKSKQLATMLSDAPAALDTLDELAAALGDDANFATTVTNSIATKLPITDPAIDMGTNKKIRFTGSIGEIDSVPGFQATNDANDGLRSMGLRGTTLRFATGDAERLRIEDNAVGIGTESPSTTDSGYNKGALHVHNASGSGAQVRWTNSTTGTGTSDGFMISKWSDKNTYLTNFDDGAKTIFTQSDSSGTLNSTALVIDGDGYVGLGTNTPGYALDINGNNFTKSSIRLTRTDSGQNNDPGIYFVNNAGANDDWGMGGIWFTNSSDSGNAYGLIRGRTDDATGTSGKLEFVTGTSAVGNFTDASMTIDSNSDVGIGTTPYANARLTIGGTEGGGYPAVLQFDNNNTSGAEFFMLATDTNWSFGANKFIMGHGAPSSSNVDFSIDSNGLVGVGPYAPNDSGGFGTALDISGSGGGGLYLTDYTDSKQGTVGMWDSNLSIHSRPADGEISFYISNDKQFKIIANGSFQAEDQNNRSAAIVSPTNVVHTGAYPYHPGGDGIGNNQTNSLQMVFAHIYQRVWSSGRYMHIKTNIPVSGSNYGMVVVYAKGYRYAPAGSIDSSWGFHNWSTALYSLDQRNYATTFAVNAYVSSDSYVVLVGDNQTTGTSYTGFQLSFLYSNTNYPAHTQTIGGFSHKVLAASLSSSTSGVY